MKNVRTLATSMFALGCLGLFGLVSCAENAIMPPSEAIGVQKSVKGSVPSVAINSEKKPVVDGEFMSNLRATVRISGTTVNNGIITVFFSVVVNDRLLGFGDNVGIFRTVTGMNPPINSPDVFVGGYLSGSYAASSPQVASGCYRLKLSVDPEYGNSSSEVDVCVP